MSLKLSYLLAPLYVGVVACAASPSPHGEPGATGGASGSGGVSGTGTGGAATGTGGNSSGLILGTGGPFPFPQNRKPGMCTLTTANGAPSAVQAAYDYWKSNFVTASGAASGLRVRRPSNQDDTVSEGIGYGMIAAVYMADRTTFDGLWTYAKAHFDTHGLMIWHLSASGATLDAGSASDGDLDIAWALIMGSNQWSSATYLSAAKSMINNISSMSLGPDGMLKPGDGWGGTTLTNPSYFSPAYFRVFAAVTGDANWSGPILDRNYEILAAVTGANGLVPDWTNNQSTVNQGNLANAMTPGNYDNSHYGYDACRTPWRIALDYCFNGEPRAMSYLTKVGAFFSGVGASNIGDQYAVTGMPTMGNKNMAFIGTAGVAGMAGYQALLDGAFAYGSTNNGGNTAYFPQSLRVLSMLMMSGNFIDFTKPR